MLGMIINANAQIFNSGFENNNGTPLSNFKTINADGKTVPASAEVQSFNTEAWIQFYDGLDNKIAFSTSLYSPVGQSNDWLITPSITIPNTGNPTLYWKAKSYDFEFTDSYVIKVSETDNNMASFTKTIETVEGEQPFDFNNRSIDLSQFKGKTIHIAFVNNTNDGTYLALDDVYISNTANCIMPSMNKLSVNNLQTNSFDIGWDPTAGISKYDTGLTTFSTPVSSTGISANTTKTYNNLEAGKRYQFFLKNSDCGSGWAGPKSIFTPSKLPYSYDFEKTVENFGEYDSDGWSSNTWINGENTSAAQQGSGYAFNNTSKTTTKNDWLFSYPISLKAGESVDVKFYAAMSLDEASPATLKLSVASSPDRDHITKMINKFSVTGKKYSQFKETYIAEKDEVIYFAFGNATEPVAVNASLRLDNVNFTATQLAVNESNLLDISIHPNPAKDYLKINTNSEILKSEIYSINGQLLNTTKASKTIDIKALQKGIYLIKIKTANNQVIKKFIKE